MEFSWIRRVFGPRVLEEAESRFNGLLRVIKNSGSVYISTGILTQTGGLIKDVWEPTIKKLTKTSSTDPESFLILGLAGGTLARLISRYFSGSVFRRPRPGFCLWRKVFKAVKKNRQISHY